MSGKTINIQQAKLYMNYRKQNIKQVAAAAKTSISERSARRIDKDEHCSFNVKTQRNWRTRQDPLAQVWDDDLVKLLQQEPKLTPSTLFDYLMEHYPQRFDNTIMRTLQCRVKQWKLLHGAEQLNYFYLTLFFPYKYNDMFILTTYKDLAYKK